MAKIFPPGFSKTQEAVDLFIHVCDYTAECELCLVDLAVVLKKLTKFIIAFNRPNDQHLLKRILKLIEKAKKQTLDDDVRGMVAATFRGITKVYGSNIPLLVEIYSSKLSAFIRAQIENGRTVDEDQWQRDKKGGLIKSNEGMLSEFSLFDAPDKDKQKAKEVIDDQNYIVNR